MSTANRPLSCGLIGWRGMVGSVLMERMKAEDDFAHISPTFFSTSQAGQPGPDYGQGPSGPLADAYDLEALAAHEVLITCQGGDYTRRVHPELRASGWDGLWIDAASALRMADSAFIVLDPLNGEALDAALASGVRDIIGGNCTVSLMLMATAGLFKAGLVEWISTMTYQAASGAGARQMKELVQQMAFLGQQIPEGGRPIDVERAITGAMRHPDLPTAALGHPLAASLLPWVDKAVEGGSSREEWKGMVETNKILGLPEGQIPVDGTCVRVGSLRCHAQGLTIKLKRAVALPEIEEMLASAHDWVEVVPNTPEASLTRLTPTAVTGKLTVPIGRLKTLKMGPEYLNAFTVGDQLLWGAAEPLRRTLRRVLSTRR